MVLVFTLFLASKETRGLRRKQPGCVGSLWLQHRKLSAASSSGVQQQPELQGCPGSALPRVRCLRPFFFRVWVCWQQSPILCKLLKQLFFISQMHRLPFAAPVGHPCSPSMWGLWGGTRAGVKSSWTVLPSPAHPRLCTAAAQGLLSFTLLLTSC